MKTLNSGDGMTAANSLPEERKEVLETLYGTASFDAVKYGFYIGTFLPKPIADYGGNMCKNEINFMEFKNSLKNE